MLKFVVLFYQCLMCFQCLPVMKNQIPSDKELQFMKRYGYIVDDNGKSEALYSEEGIKNVIKTVQRYGGIKETGIIDNSTLKLMSSPRCGVPDIIQNKRKKRYALVDSWNKRNITYYIANWSPNLGEATVTNNIQKALDIWGGYGRLKFTRSYSQYADIIVAFGNGYHGDSFPFDGPGQILAHAFFPYDYEGPDLGGDIHFDNDENWADLTYNVGDQSGTDFFTVALHELGHSLGLGHSAVPSSVMFPYYKGFDPDSQYTLDYDDIMGMYDLYISKKLKNDDSPYYPDQEFPTPSPHPTTRYREETTSTRIRTTTRDREETTPPNKNNPWYGARYPTSSNRPDVTVWYGGDDESVDDHKKHDPKHKIPKNNSPSLPDICNSHLDAVATLRSELFIFKDEYIWRLKEKGRIEAGYPIPIRQMFPDLPKNIKKIDAAYQRPDGNIVLFTGKKLWIYDGSRFIENSPLPLSYYRLPDYVESVDAVQTWARNGKTYFYKNDRFWRYDESTQTMDPGYPMHMDRWRGVPHDLDAATTWKDGVTYFFKGDLFWKFDNDWVITTNASPFPLGPIWLGCKEEEAKMRKLFGPK